MCGSRSHLRCMWQRLSLAQFSSHCARQTNAISNVPSRFRPPFRPIPPVELRSAHASSNLSRTPLPWQRISFLVQKQVVKLMECLWQINQSVSTTQGTIKMSEIGGKTKIKNTHTSLRVILKYVCKLFSVSWQATVNKI